VAAKSDPGPGLTCAGCRSAEFDGRGEPPPQAAVALENRRRRRFLPAIRAAVGFEAEEECVPRIGSAAMALRPRVELAKGGWTFGLYGWRIRRLSASPDNGTYPLPPTLCPKVFGFAQDRWCGL